MPQKRISFSNFNRRLALAGGREQTGPGGLRRAQNVAPELTNSVMSRWGSSSLYAINAIQLYYWAGARYAYDGSALYKNGVSIKTGFNGSRLAFNSMPPQPGLPDYLFILGGGVAPFKIDPSGGVSNWGIVEPPNGMAAFNGFAPDQTVIDSFFNSAANWTPSNCTIANNTTDFPVGSGALNVNPTAGPWQIIRTFGSYLDLASYASGDLSLQTDVVQFWVYFHGSFNTTWLEIDFDVSDGTFRNDYYSFIVGLVSPTAQSKGQTPGVQFNELLTFQQDQWQQVTIAKSQFIRTGSRLHYDWPSVHSVRIRGGNFTSYMAIDNLILTGGDGKGVGPAITGAGSEYDYYVVYRNTVTGSQSNSQPDPVRLRGVKANRTFLANVPVSSDPQVGARDIYRTQALTGQSGGGTPFYLDTIPDNATTSYTDVTSDFSIPLTTIPWQTSVAVPINTVVPYDLDGGNGYRFRLVTAGTTGASQPNWNVPTTTWTPLTPLELNETIPGYYPYVPSVNGQVWKVTTAGVTGKTQPNWGSRTTPGQTIADGTVVWTNQGYLDTTDGTVVWQFMGINSTRVLGNDQLLLDNAPPSSTIEDAWGPHEGSMFFCRDTVSGNGGYVYASPPGRPESLGQAYLIGSENDLTQKLVGWDGALWLFTQNRAFQLLGTYPAITADAVDYALGTNSPFTIVPVQMVGIIYWAPDGIRVMNWAGSRLIGFEQIAPVLRGQNEEDVGNWMNVTGFGPTWAALMRDEIVFSGGTDMPVSLALAYDGLWGGSPTWRTISPVLTALYYEPQTGYVQAAFGGGVYEFEQPYNLTDGLTAIPFEVQSPGDFPDPGAQFTTQRLYITANLKVSAVQQTLTPIVTIDGVDYTLSAITGSQRQTFELAPKIAGRFFDGVRLTGNLTGRVEVFRIEADVWLGEQQDSQ